MLPICNPRLVGDPTIAPKILTPDDDPDGTIEADLGDYMILSQDATRFNQVKKKLRERLIPGDNLIVGDLVVNWKVHGKGWKMIVTGVGE